jgi:hypothetical protein
MFCRTDVVRGFRSPGPQCATSSTCVEYLSLTESSKPVLGNLRKAEVVVATDVKDFSVKIDDVYPSNRPGILLVREKLCRYVDCELTNCTQEDQCILEGI